MFLFPVCSPYFLPRESTSMRIWNKKKGISSPGCSWCQLCSSSVWCLLRSQCCQQSWVIKSKSMSRKNPLSGFHHFDSGLWSSNPFQEMCCLLCMLFLHWILVCTKQKILTCTDLSGKRLFTYWPLHENNVSFFSCIENRYSSCSRVVFLTKEPSK